MPVRKGQRVDTERTRTTLLDAATDLFYRRGLPGAGVDEIAARAGVSKLSLYRHFANKEGLVDAVLRRRSARVQGWLADAARAGGETPFEQLLAVYDALADWYAQPAFRGCAIVSAAMQMPEADGPARQVAREHLDAHRRLLGDLTTQAGCANPDRVARQLLILLEGATTVAALTGAGEAANDARAAARTLLLSEDAR